MSAYFAFVPSPEGGRVSLLQGGLFGRRQLPFHNWEAAAGEERAPALRYLRRELAGGKASQQGSAVVLSTDALLALPPSIAGLLHLPDVAPLSLGLSLLGRIETPDGEIRIGWTDSNYRRLTPSRQGMFVTFAGGTGRLTATLFRLIEAIEAYNATTGMPGERRIPHWLSVQKQLEPLTGSVVTADQVLQNLRIFQAGAFALDVREAQGGLELDPVLMSADMRSTLADETDAPEDGGEATPDVKDSEQHALLPPELQRQFVRSFSTDRVGTRPSYVLGRNTYLVVEPELQVALDVVKRIRRAPDQVRREFLRNPRSYIAQALPDAGEEVGTIFIETRQYSERVRGLGAWVKLNLEWLKRQSSGWLPERFMLQIGDRAVEMDEGRVTTLAAALEFATDRGDASVSFDNELFGTDEVAAALESLRGVAAEKAAAEAGPAAPPDRNVLLKAENIEDADFAVSPNARPLVVPKLFPSDLVVTQPKQHQVTGFGWLVEAWTSGLPGALLADDMGLGKTLQALAFLAWFRANRRAAGAKGRKFTGPILIVAPTALLRNWQKEASNHLVDGCLGECQEAFGPGLGRLKYRNADSPEDALDVARIRDADWVLTTYETLANYHRVFARVAFSLAVFDEMQKIKSPDTINTHAAKVMNADFVLGMTGTPIENRIEDIWCLMDRLAPGHLGALKSFSARYGAEDPSELEALKGSLDQPQGKNPPLMLRRMKHDHLKGLPERVVRTYRDTPMPPAQAEAYEKIVEGARGAQRSQGEMLKIIHSLRGVSLHPHGAGSFDPYDPDARRNWVASSARVAQALEVLERVNSLGEKALVFIEDRAVQAAFSAVAASHFKLSAEPEIINGELAGDRRQQVVDRFQSLPPGFGLLVLSPKAAGIGLTITAANHVVHLSRWWNPAVEDQCNDRVYRIGQTKPVTVHIPMAVHPGFGDSSFDVKLDALLERKRTLSRDMLVPPVSEGDAAALYSAAVANLDASVPA